MVLVGIQNLQGSVTPHEFCTTACFVWRTLLAPEPLFLIHLATDDDLVAEGDEYNIVEHGYSINYRQQPTWSCFLLFCASFVDTLE